MVRGPQSPLLHTPPGSGIGRRRLLGALGLGAVVLGIGLTGAAVRRPYASVSGSGSIWKTGNLPMFDQRQWLNSDPLGPASLEGKVVLVNFWTYSCINSLRTLPYLRAWAAKYRERGLVVIGPHSPEFAFEHDVGNVRVANSALGLNYPVVIDNDFGIWRSFGNRAWPGFFFVGADGRLRHTRFGEGRYDQSEQVIQALVSEAVGAPVTDPIVDIAGEGAEAAPDWIQLASPETHIGHRRASNFVSPGGLRPDVTARYEAPPSLSRNHWALSGSWTVGPEFATLEEAGGQLRFNFRARDLHLVLGRNEGTGPLRYRVSIDAEAPGTDRGVDTDAEGWGAINEPRMYQMVRQEGEVVDRTFAVEFLDPGARAYVFTFG